MLVASSAGGRRPGRVFPSMTLEPPQPLSSPTSNVLKQTHAELATSTENFTALVKHHAQVVIAARRLEAAYCRQAEGLLQAKQSMDGADPASLGEGGPEAFPTGERPSEDQKDFDGLRGMAGGNGEGVQRRKRLQGRSTGRFPSTLMGREY